MWGLLPKVGWAVVGGLTGVRLVTELLRLVRLGALLFRASGEVRQLFSLVALAGS